MSKQFVIGSVEWLALQRSGALDKRPPIPPEPQVNRHQRSQRPATSRGALRELFYKNKGICVYCKRETDAPRMLPRTRSDLTATIDHFIPISKGGPRRGSNCVLACNGCNNLKSNLDPKDWQAFMDTNPNWWETAWKPMTTTEIWDGVCPAMLACSNTLFYERYKHRGVFKFY